MVRTPLVSRSSTPVTVARIIANPDGSVTGGSNHPPAPALACAAAVAAVAAEVAVAVTLSETDVEVEAVEVNAEEEAEAAATEAVARWPSRPRFEFESEFVAPKEEAECEARSIVRRRWSLWLLVNPSEMRRGKRTPRRPMVGDAGLRMLAGSFFLRRLHVFLRRFHVFA